MIHILSVVVMKVVLRCFYLDGDRSVLIKNSGVSQFNSNCREPVNCGHGHLSGIWAGDEQSITTRDTNI